MRDIPERLLALFTVGLLLFNVPAMAIANQRATLGGIPVLYLYLFGVWLAIILALAALARARWSPPDADDPDG